MWFLGYRPVLKDSWAVVLGVVFGVRAGFKKILAFWGWFLGYGPVSKLGLGVTGYILGTVEPNSMVSDPVLFLLKKNTKAKDPIQQTTVLLWFHGTGFRVWGM